MKQIVLFIISNVILICLFTLIWIDVDYKLPLKILLTSLIVFKIIETHDKME